IQLFALSESLPVTSRHMQAVFRGTTALYRAQYLVGRQHKVSYGTFESILCYPMCSQDVLPHLSQLVARHLSHAPQCFATLRLPRRLFRSLVALSDPAKSWTKSTHPLPFLEQLYSTAGLPQVDPNSHDGYALTKAVHANFIPLIRFLLAHGADPGAKGGLAVSVAIRRRDLGLVRMLIERVDATKKGTGKRRRLGDRVVATNAMLRTAVKCDARDIVQYFREEKGLVPDLKTLSTLPSFDSPAAALPAYTHSDSPLKRKRR
ncbi:hypothetical protein FIBSPDRAFT_849195, partial [Athelia psychrophila]